MQATHEEIETLHQLQQTDLDVKRLMRELDELPQRQQILDARNKRMAIEDNRAKIQTLRKEAAKKLTRINDEDASLEKKEAGLQAAIEAAGNDFRNAEARTKELNGIFKRRGELVENRKKVEEELAKIKAMDAQIEGALSDIDEFEQSATESFKHEGTVLMQQISETKAKREALLNELSGEVAALFNKTSNIFDTVSIARLEGNACSICRAKIESGRLIDIKRQAPLATCPSCKRILVIE